VEIKIAVLLSDFEVLRNDREFEYVSVVHLHHYGEDHWWRVERSAKEEVSAKKLIDGVYHLSILYLN